MQIVFSQRSGSAARAISWDKVSTQKSHTGRRGADRAQKNTTAPPVMPSSRYSRSSPARRSRNRNTALPTLRQYRRSSHTVSRGRRRRKGRSRSYSSPADSPSRMDQAKASSCWETELPMAHHPNSRWKKPPRSPPPSS